MWRKNTKIISTDAIHSSSWVGQAAITSRYESEQLRTQMANACWCNLIWFSNVRNYLWEYNYTWIGDKSDTLQLHDGCMYPTHTYMYTFIYTYVCHTMTHTYNRYHNPDLNQYVGGCRLYRSKWRCFNIFVYFIHI